MRRYWLETVDENEEDTLDGYEYGTLTRRDLKTLEEGGELTGDIASEIARRLTEGVPHVALLDSAFLEKVAPSEGRGSRCRSRYWEQTIGVGTDSRVGTAKTTIIALHYTPKHWCCATADLTSKRLVYYDSFYSRPSMRALDALGDYVDQVAADQGVHPTIGAASFTHKLHTTPKQPDGVSCGVCTLIEIQRIAGGVIDSPRDEVSDVGELARYRAKWACEVLSNPAPTRNRTTRPPRRRRAARDPAGTDDSDMEMGETRPPAACRRTSSSQPSNRKTHNPTGNRARTGDKNQKKGPAAQPESRKRGRDAARHRQERKGVAQNDPSAARRRAAPPLQAAHAAPGIPPQELAVGEKVPPDKTRVGCPKQDQPEQRQSRCV